MAGPALTAGRLTAPAPDPALPLLVVGPSLGTTTVLWAQVAAALEGQVEVVGFDLPGHGESPSATAPFTVTDLAAAVRALAEQYREGRDGYHYAGDSLGGAIGLALAAAAPQYVRSLTAVCTGAKIGEPSAWADRAALVRDQGTRAVVDSSRQRWFGPGFDQRRPQVVADLLQVLSEVDAGSYALACEALAGFDIRSGLARIQARTVVISGSHDVATPPEAGAQIATGVPGARQIVLDGVGHLAPVEAPEQVVAVLQEQTTTAPAAGV